MRYLLAVCVLWAGCAMATGQDTPTDGDLEEDPEAPLCEDGEELPCCSWSDLYIGTCEDGRLVGCGWCLEPDGRPGQGPWTW